MENIGALRSGVFTAIVDQHTEANNEAEKAADKMKDPDQAGAVTYSENDDKSALVKPVTDRGTLFDVMF